MAQLIIYGLINKSEMKVKNNSLTEDAFYYISACERSRRERFLLRFLSAVIYNAIYETVLFKNLQI